MSGLVDGHGADQETGSGAETFRADGLAANAPDQAWKRRGRGDGACSIGRLPPCPAIRAPRRPGWSRYRLARCSLTRNGEGELAYYQAT